MRKITSIEEQKRLIELEKRERYSIIKIVDMMKLIHPEYEYTVYTSLVHSACPYDAILTIREQGEVVKTFMIELKNRVDMYDELIYEKIKHTSLTKEKKTLKLELGRDCDILYINTTKDATYIFPIDEMKLPKTQKRLMAIESFANQYEQKNKSVYLLNHKEAIKFNFKYDEQTYLKSIEPVKVAPIETTKEIKIISLF